MNLQTQNLVSGQKVTVESINFSGRTPNPKFVAAEFVRYAGWSKDGAFAVVRSPESGRLTEWPVTHISTEV